MRSLFEYPVLDHMPPYISEGLLADLELGKLLRRYFDEPERYLTTDERAISERNGLVRLLHENPELLAAFRGLLTALSGLGDMVKYMTGEPLQIIDGAGVFRELYNACEGAAEAAERVSVKGDIGERIAGLPAELRAFLSENYSDEFEREWENYAPGIGKIRSLVFRLGFSDDIEVSTLALERVGDKRVKRMGARRFKLTQPDFTKYYSDFNRNMDVVMSTGQMAEVLSLCAEYMMQNQSEALKSSVRIKCSKMLGEIGQLYDDLKFLTGAVACAEAYGGLGMCHAKVHPMDERVFHAKGMFHPQLAEYIGEEGVTRNDASLMAESGIVLLGGANRGGKTTFLRTCAAVQVLFQMGLPLPARAASLSPVSAIACIFSKEEGAGLGSGKLGNEIEAICAAIKKMDSTGFFVFNEPISATSPTESYLLSRDTLCMLKIKGARGIWVTHHLRMFDDIDAMNERFCEPPASVVSAAHVRTGQSRQNNFTVFAGHPENTVGAKELFWSGAAE